MDKNDFINELRAMPDLDFCRKHMFSDYMWIFQSGVAKRGTYEDFKRTVGSLVGANSSEIAIVGSAKFGFSLSPNKAFTPFHSNSDLDLIIVSASLFEQIWHAYRLADYNGYYWIRRNYAGDIFRKYVVVHPEERKEYKSAYLRRTWLEMGKIDRDVDLIYRLGRPIKYRVYASWEDAENYHVKSLADLRRAVL